MMNGQGAHGCGEAPVGMLGGGGPAETPVHQAEFALLDLPEPCLALILSWCSIPCVGCARRSCHALRLMTVADAELVWTRMAEAWRWRLRRREDECAESIVRRGYKIA